MKRIYILIISLFFAGCSFNERCDIIAVPDNVKPIDWEGYNDVSTVYWNNTGDCLDFTIGSTGKTIKLYGRIVPITGYGPHPVVAFSLSSDSVYIAGSNPCLIEMRCGGDQFEFLLAEYIAAEGKMRCYVTGDLVINSVEEHRCCFAIPEIFVRSIDSIYCY